MRSPPALSTHRDLSRDLSNRQIQRLVETRALTRVRRGFYVSTPVWTALSIDERALLGVRAAAGALSQSAVLSHTSAAIVHGLPTGTLRQDRIHVTWPGSAGRGTTSCVTNHRSILSDRDIVEVDGLRVTSAARTVYDIARGAEVRLAVAVVDQGLRRGVADELARCLERNAGKPGSGRAARVVDAGDARSESVGESISRVQFRQLGIPTPVLQQVVNDATGRAVARVDFLFADFGTAVEFDGKVKYQKFLRLGETPAEVVFREKLREDAIRSTGLDVVRMTCTDHEDDAKILARCRPAFARQGHAGWRPASPGLVGWPTLLR